MKEIINMLTKFGKAVVEEMLNNVDSQKLEDDELSENERFAEELQKLQVFIDLNIECLTTIVDLLNKDCFDDKAAGLVLLARMASQYNNDPVLYKQVTERDIDEDFEFFVNGIKEVDSYIEASMESSDWNENVCLETVADHLYDKVIEYFQELRKTKNKEAKVSLISIDAMDITEETKRAFVFCRFYISKLFQEVREMLDEDELEKATQLFLDYRLDDAEEKLLELSEKRNARAMYLLGLLYSSVPKLNIDKAKEYFKEGYKEGDVLAASRWGQITNYSDYFSDAYNEWISGNDRYEVLGKLSLEHMNEIFEMAQDGDVFACYEEALDSLNTNWEIGMDTLAYLETGYPGESDNPNAIERYNEYMDKAADKGFWVAIISAMSFDRKEKLLELAEKDNAAAQYRLALYYIFYEMIGHSFDSSTDEYGSIMKKIEEAERISDMWMEKAANNGYPRAMINRIKKEKERGNIYQAKAIANKAVQVCWLEDDKLEVISLLNDM